MQEKHENKGMNRIGLESLCDTTAIIDVQFFIKTHKRDLLDAPGIIDEIDEYLATDIPEDEKERKKILEAGVTLLNNFSKKTDRTRSGMAGISALHAIRQGQIFLYLKKVIKKAGMGNWDEWATQKFPFISQSTRIVYMRLASRSDCYPYALLGLERILLLITATEGGHGDDRIGEFLKKHGIKFDPESRETVKSFKLAVDSALNMEKIEKLGLSISKDLVTNLTQYRREFDSNLLITVKTIADSRGDIDAYFEKLIQNKGKERDPLGDSKVVWDFNDVGAKLLRILGYFEKNSEAQETIEPAIVHELIIQLTKFRDQLSEK